MTALSAQALERLASSSTKARTFTVTAFKVRCSSITLTLRMGLVLLILMRSVVSAPSDKACRVLMSAPASSIIERRASLTAACRAAAASSFSIAAEPEAVYQPAKAGFIIPALKPIKRLNPASFNLCIFSPCADGAVPAVLMLGF